MKNPFRHIARTSETTIETLIKMGILIEKEDGIHVRENPTPATKQE